jgi:hypothetical protein
MDCVYASFPAFKELNSRNKPQDEMQEVPQDSDIVRSSQQQKLFYAQNELSGYVTGEDSINCMGIVFTEEYECGFFGMVYYSCQGSSP